MDSEYCCQDRLCFIESQDSASNEGLEKGAVAVVVGRITVSGHGFGFEGNWYPTRSSLIDFFRGADLTPQSPKLYFRIETQTRREILH